jgi:hypothetical protein
VFVTPPDGVASQETAFATCLLVHRFMARRGQAYTVFQPEWYQIRICDIDCLSRLQTSTKRDQHKESENISAGHILNVRLPLPVSPQLGRHDLPHVQLRNRTIPVLNGAPIFLARYLGCGSPSGLLVHPKRKTAWFGCDETARGRHSHVGEGNEDMACQMSELLPQ